MPLVPLTCVNLHNFRHKTNTPKMSGKDMNFDLVLDEIGEFGRYQQTNFLLLSLPVIFAAANSLSYVFTAGSPNYR